MDDWLILLKKLLGIPPEDTSQDETILFVAGIALQAIQVRTGRTFIPGIFLDTMPGPYQKVYTIEHPIIEVIEVAAAGTVLAESEYQVNLETGAIRFTNRCRCWEWFYNDCCIQPLTVKYQANHELPPDWVSMVVADAIRASMATAAAGNQFGFLAKKVSVTDVGSVEFGMVGDSPSQSISVIVDGSLEGWTAPVMASSYGCCNGPQTSDLIEKVDSVRRIA